MNKKSIAIVAGLLMAGSLNSLAIGSHGKGQSSQLLCQPFKKTQVHLLPSRFQENMKRDSAWMMSIQVGSLLQSFRNTSGAFSSREGGYLSAFAEGLIDRNIQGKSVWAPFYTLHKIVQGMIDQYQMTGNEKALEIAKGMGNWAYNKLKPLSEETRKLMIRNEFGGFNESMYELYALTKDEKYLWVARYFYHNEKIDPLKAGNPNLGTNHAFVTMQLREEATKDDASKVAFVYGPIVMAGKLDKVEHPFSNPQKYNDYYTFDFKIPASTVEKAKYEGLKSIKNFKMKNGVELVPFYDAHHCRYAVYWQK